MPVYEYRCGSCGHCFEVKRGFGETSPQPCPRCQGKSRKVFKPVPIIYKGSGFYSTDHRPTNWSGEEAKDKPAEKAATKSEPKTEAKAK